MMAKEHFIERTYGPVTFSISAPARSSCMQNGNASLIGIYDWADRRSKFSRCLDGIGEHRGLHLPRQLLDGSDAMGSGGILELGRSELRGKWRRTDQLAAWAVAFKGLSRRRMRQVRYRQANVYDPQTNPIESGTLWTTALRSCGRGRLRHGVQSKKTIATASRIAARHHRHPVRAQGVDEWTDYTAQCR